MRNMGGLRTKMPTTFWVYLIGALALAGIAPLSGFFSKDEILVAATQYNMGIFILLILAAFLTAFYMGRQILLVFFGSTRTRAAGAANENRPVVTIPLIILAVLSVVGGGLNLPGSHILETWLEHTIEGLHAGAFVPLLAGLALLVALAGLFAAWLVYGMRAVSRAQDVEPLAARMPGLFRALNAKWWIDEFYENTVVRGYKGLSAFLAGPFDQGLIDGIVNGFGYVSRGLSASLRLIQNGFVRSYALMLVIGVVAILAYLVFWQMR
jgi:NADH-quinone oxidoreductase subunit L